MKKIKFIKDNTKTVVAKKKVNKIKKSEEIKFNYDELEFLVVRNTGIEKNKCMVSKRLEINPKRVNKSVSKKRKNNTLNFLPLDDDFPEGSDN